MKKIQLLEMLRPQYDPFTKGKFKGNHRDLIITRSRQGDKVTESASWARDSAGMFYNHREQSFWVSELIAISESYGLKVIDDIPQGSSLVD